MDKKTKKEENKAGYTATEVARGWAGAVMKKAGAVTQKPPVMPKTLTRTDRLIDGRTDRHIDIESRYIYRYITIELSIFFLILNGKKNVSMIQLNPFPTDPLLT